MERFDTAFFDAFRDRSGTGSIKYGTPPEGAPENLLPMWVADMDFLSPPAIGEALARTGKQGIYGYTEVGGAYWELLRSWYLRRMDWPTETDWYSYIPSVLGGVSAAILALTREDDGVLLLEPVYYPFKNIITGLGRKPVVSELREESGRYCCDFSDIDEKASHCKALLLCSPHNPVGRVWEREELEELGRICKKHDLSIISDEIHADLVYTPNRHIPMASVSPELAERTVTCMAPTKTFNMAGLAIAHLIIPNAELRRRVRRTCSAMGQGAANLMSIAAATAAYREGEAWLDGLLAYLKDSRELLYRVFPAGAKVHALPLEGTYLAWLDCRALSEDAEALEDAFLKKAGLWLDNGAMFGESGSGFMRLNFACPRDTLQEAIRRIESLN